MIKEISRKNSTLPVFINLHILGCPGHGLTAFRKRLYVSLSVEHFVASVTEIHGILHSVAS